jgi:hypothetical protein
MSERIYSLTEPLGASVVDAEPDWPAPSKVADELARLLRHQPAGHS